VFATFAAIEWLSVHRQLARDGEERRERSRSGATGVEWHQFGRNVSGADEGVNAPACTAYIAAIRSWMRGVGLRRWVVHHAEYAQGRSVEFHTP